jgi:hypothetical protein
MSDIMELVEKTLEDHYNYWIFKGEIDKSEKIAEESLSKLESRISAMQEVCDAAVLYKKYTGFLPDDEKPCNCCQCNLLRIITKYEEAIKE